MLVIILIGIFDLVVVALTDMWKMENPQDVKGCNMIAVAALSSYVWVLFHL